MKLLFSKKKEREVSEYDRKTEEDFNGLKEIGRIVAAIRDTLVERTVPGVTTKELDDLAGELFEKEGPSPHPKVSMTFLVLPALA